MTVRGQKFIAIENGNLTIPAATLFFPLWVMGAVAMVIFSSVLVPFWLLNEGRLAVLNPHVTLGSRSTRVVATVGTVLMVIAVLVAAYWWYSSTLGHIQVCSVPGQRPCP
jgi:hypothetical protein